MNSFFATDGPFFTFIMKAGQVIILTVMCLVFCIPVITIIPAFSALYYAVMKSVRRERGYIHKEFLRAFKHGLLKGIILTLMYGGFTAAIIFNLYIVDESNITFIASYVVLLVITAISFVHIIPVLSRFNMRTVEMIKLSFHMGIRHFPVTVLLLAGWALTVFLQIRVLPMVAITFLPGTWIYISTFLSEKVMRGYMEKIISAEENDDNSETADKWYLE